MTFDLVCLRVRKLLASLQDARFARALRLGVAPTIDHRQALARLDPELVIDIGANRGQFALFARHCWPRARIVSFEPLPAAGTLCRAVMSGDPNFTLIEAAVAVNRGTSAINITVDDDSSSLLPLGERHQALYGSTVAQTLEVQTGRLTDFLAAAEIPPSALIKIDVQGFELEVLKASEDVLPLVSHIYAELSFVELYGGQPLAGEAVSYLDARGFDLAGVYNQSVDRAASPIQADMLFSRRQRSRDRGEAGNITYETFH